MYPTTILQKLYLLIGNLALYWLKGGATYKLVTHGSPLKIFYLSIGHLALYWPYAGVTYKLVTLGNILV